MATSTTAPEDVRATWEDRTRIVLTPIAAPSILGLFGFAGATFIVASNLAGWWGNDMTSPGYLAPFAAAYGGLAQFVAGVWSYRARDGLATAMHCTWGSFWLAYGLFTLLIATGIFPASAATSTAFGFWFIALCVVTTFGAVAASAKSLGLLTVLGLLAAGAGLLAAGLVGAIPGLVTVAGYVLVASAAAAFYVAGALMLAESFGGRTVLPLGEYNKASNIPSSKIAYPVEYAHGMPGAKVGQ